MCIIGAGGGGGMLVLQKSWRIMCYVDEPVDILV